MVQPSIEIRIFLKTFKALCRAKPMCDPTMDEVNSEFLINLHTAHWICVYLNVRYVHHFTHLENYWLFCIFC